MQLLKIFRKLLMVWVALLASLILFAQDDWVHGKVVDAASGLPIQGATIQVKGTNSFVISDNNGLFQIKSTVVDKRSLIISSVGYQTMELKPGAAGILEIKLEISAQTLSDVVVTGVGIATQQKKVPFSVEKIDAKAFKNVPASDAAGVLQGKVTGIKLAKTGEPGSGTSIRLRAAKQIFGSNDPLIIIDGVLTDGNLQDLNAEDIASIEVVKGSAGSALYGSRAANGVIHIITKRGQRLAAGKTVVEYRTEYGRNFIGFTPKRSAATNYMIVNGAVDYSQMKPDGIIDNPYPKVIDQYREFFNPGEYFTNHLSVMGKSTDGKASIYAAVQNTKDAGVVKLTNGQNRVNVKANLDYRLSDKITLSTSNLYAQSTIDYRGGGVWSNFMQSDPDADLLQKNLNGTPYLVNPNHINPLIGNPLYDINNSRSETNRKRYLSNYALNYRPFSNTTVDLNYGLDNGVSESFYISPKGKLRVDDPTVSDPGYISQSTNTDVAQTVQVDFSQQYKIRDFNTKYKLQYIYERNYNKYVSAYGSDLALTGMEITNVSQAANQYASSYVSEVIASNYSALANADYKGKYILDALVRRDGVSLFGSDVRWHTFYRIAAAWRISEDFHINGIDEMKLRAAYGTAGLRPPFEAQYETYSIINGSLGSQSTLGNKDLKPSVNQEAEIGLDVNFLKRYSFAFNFAQGKCIDLILPVPVSAVTGASLQYQNAASLRTTTFEWTLRGTVIDNRNLTWDLGFTFDKNLQKVLKLNRSGYAIVSGGIFRIQEGMNFGTLWGRRWAHTLADVVNQVPQGKNVEDIFVVNNEGFVVRKDAIGTKNEVPVYKVDANGLPKDSVIGNVNPHFNLNMSSNLTFKGFNLYALFAWQNGGQTYNHTRRYTTYSSELDQSGKPYSQRKSELYYTKLKEWNNEYFVEKADFLALREAALNYDFKNIKVGKLKMENVRLGVVGRNLFMITRYTGFSPETGSNQEGVDANVLKFDVHSYPVYRTVSFNLTITM